MSQVAAKAAVVAAEKLRAWGSAIFQATGMAAEQADVCAEILVDSNLRGIDTHGIYLANLYARRLKINLMNPKPKLKFEKRRAGVGILDGDYGLGQWITYEATRRAMDLARDAGVGVVAVKNSNHFGAAAYYTQMMAKEDMIGLVMSDGECDVVPFGGREKFCGTDPISLCVPAENQPWFCMDMATSEVAFGKVRAAAEAGKTIPPTWAVDKQGNPVTDARQAYAVVPMSGAKGYALGIMIEILSSQLTCMPFGPHIIRKFDDWSNKSFLGHYVQAIDISAFCDPADFRKRIDRMFTELKAIPTAPGFSEIMVPGEPEERKKAERAKTGCPIRAEDVALLSKLGQDLAVPFPG